MRITTIWRYSFATLAAASSGRDSKNCAVMVGSYENISYRYYASSKNCAAMSQKDDIKNALEDYLALFDEDDVPVWDCIAIDEGGPWKGWMLYGRLGEVDLTRYCGPKIVFGKGYSRSEL
jgi:hypothetical protein